MANGLRSDIPAEARSGAIHCPYGQPGDRLWVKETHQYCGWTDDGYPWIRYQANGAKKLHERIPDEWSEKLQSIWADLSDPENFNIDNKAADRKWRPAIHMPRWASRITLEVVSVSVERVQEITELEVAAEGFEKRGNLWHPMDSTNPIYAFELYWDLLNEQRGFSWRTNPWVWVIALKDISNE